MASSEIRRNPPLPSAFTWIGTGVGVLVGGEVGVGSGVSVGGNGVGVLVGSGVLVYVASAVGTAVSGIAGCGAWVGAGVEHELTIRTNTTKLMMVFKNFIIDLPIVVCFLKIAFLLLLHLTFNAKTRKLYASILTILVSPCYGGYAQRKPISKALLGLLAIPLVEFNPI